MKPNVWRTGDLKGNNTITELRTILQREVKGHGKTLLIPLKPSDEGHKIEHKEAFDSVTRTWVIEMKPNVWRTGGNGWTLLVPLKASDEGHKIEHKQTFDSVTRTSSYWDETKCVTYKRTWVSTLSTYKT
jgi:hypothetical protein